MTTHDAAMFGDSGYDRIDHDLYSTPPENVDCLHLLEPLDGTVWWEPACGFGNISKRIEELTGQPVVSSDLIDRGYGVGGKDFLQLTKAPETAWGPVNGIITNPPFDDLAELFIRHAIKLMQPVGGRVIMFLRNEFDCGKTRRGLFNGMSPDFPFAHKIVVTKRPRWIEGSKGSPRHSYAWFVWDFAHKGGAYVSYVHPDDCPPLRSN
jgi:hypothetical protein